MEDSWQSRIAAKAAERNQRTKEELSIASHLEDLKRLGECVNHHLHESEYCHIVTCVDCDGKVVISGGGSWIISNYEHSARCSVCGEEGVSHYDPHNPECSSGDGNKALVTAFGQCKECSERPKGTTKPHDECSVCFPDSMTWDGKSWHWPRHIPLSPDGTKIGDFCNHQCHINKLRIARG